MIYRRKIYKIDPKIVQDFNIHFNNTLLPTQIKYGARLVGRWMTEEKSGVVEIFAIWEYDSYADYEMIEGKVKSDQDHVQRVQDWFEKIGRQNIQGFLKDTIKEDFLQSTIPRNKTIVQ